MFRDSRGVVHTVSSADPLLDLPEAAARALSGALLVAAERDLGNALERCDAVRDLVERWQDEFFTALPDDVDLAEEARWAAEAGVSLADVEATYEDDDEDDELDLAGLADLADDLDGDLHGDLHGDLDGDLDGDLADAAPLGPDPALVGALPEELVLVLERELLLLPLRTRLEALVAAADLVATWSDLLADHEKLLGHLVLAHEQDASRDTHEDLAQQHAALHAAAGPGHP